MEEREKMILLVNELIKQAAEKAWLEFKKDNYNPDMIGEDISALANAAVLADRSCATILELMAELGISHTTVKNNIAWLKEHGYIRCIGSDKGGHWEVIGRK